MNVQGIVVVGLAALCAAGCVDTRPSWLTVGPDFKEPEIKADTSALKAPEAGWPMTTNLTATGEFKPASAEEDPRTVLKAEDIRRWWRQFEDPILSGLVENAVSNNRSFLMAQQRLEQARWRLAGSWSDVMPHITGVGGATRSEGGANRVKKVHIPCGRKTDDGPYVQAQDKELDIQPDGPVLWI